MRFEYCGNSDCPEWVLSGIVLVNKMSGVKLKLILSQLCKKIIGASQPGGPTHDQEKLFKLCRDQKFDPEDTRCLLAILEFILA